MKGLSLLRLVAALGLGLGLGLTLPWLLDGGATPVTAAPTTGMVETPATRPPSNVAAINRYVAITGTDSSNNCASSSNPCRTVQRAVDVADSGDEILVATGIYTGVQVREEVTQVVYISETVAIRGGYNAAFTAWDPDTYTTTLDAQEQGRVAYMGGAIGAPITPTLEGFRLTGGLADYGGGLRMWMARATISGCEIFSNTADWYGGGIYLSGEGSLRGNRIHGNAAGDDGGGVYITSGSGATLTDNQVYDNTANAGGGIHVSFGDDVTLAGNHVYSNTANAGGGVFFVNSDSPTLTGNHVYSNAARSGSGGGVCVSGAAYATLAGNDVFNNRASASGGGIQVSWSNGAALTDNEVYSNTANSNGGGVYVHSGTGVTLATNRVYSNACNTNGGGIGIGADDVTLTANWIYRNTARNGGGVYFNDSADSTLTSSVVVENQATAGGKGPGINVRASDVSLLHTTIARNTGGDGSGVHVDNNGSDYSTAVLTNTILVSQTTGIFVAFGNTATLEATLWGDGPWDNGNDWNDIGYVFTGTVNLWNDPGFAEADSGDYHITFDSAAQDAGVASGVSEDIDGDSRLFDAQPDIGADEYACYVRVGSTDYASVQAAVDGATDGEVVMVAGTCRGVETRVSNQQMAYVTETLTVRGGYNAAFSEWDPHTYPTTLDAQGRGRVVFITGDVTPTIEGLRLTSGSANTSGGGIFVLNAHPIISGCQVYSNTAASSGGGIYLNNADDAALASNGVCSNTANAFGGGIYLGDSAGVDLTGNEVRDNRANYGGGLSLRESDATLVNNVIADNRANNWASGLYVWGASPRLLHNTIARNTGGDGSGLYVTDRNGVPRTVVLTNTILVSHTVGITVTEINTVTLEATLWSYGAWANGLDWGGSGHVTSTRNHTGTPSFVGPDAGDYHIGMGSAAIDAGVNADVTTDIDGETRADIPDQGADELIIRRVYLPLVLRDF